MVTAVENSCLAATWMKKQARGKVENSHPCLSVVRTRYSVRFGKTAQQERHKNKHLYAARGSTHVSYIEYLIIIRTSELKSFLAKLPWWFSRLHL